MSSNRDPNDRGDRGLTPQLTVLSVDDWGLPLDRPAFVIFMASHVTIPL